MREHMDNKRFAGELGHPTGLSDQFNPAFPVVSLSNVSHMVEEVEIHSDIMFAKVRVLDTPSGKIIKNLNEALDNNAVVFRPRAIGEVNSMGQVDVHELISFDAIPVDDDSFKDLQTLYTEMLKTDLKRTPDLQDLPEINATFQRKNNGSQEEQ
jgi:hypothetical protein